MIWLRQLKNMIMFQNNGIISVAIAVISIFAANAPGVFAGDVKEAKNLANSIESEYEYNDSSVLDSNSTLYDYLVFASLNNPGLKQSFYKWKAALEKIARAKSLPDPMLSFGYFVENVETRVGPQQWRLGLAQSYPWFGTLARKGDIAFESANAAYQHYQMARLKLFYNVKSAYYDYYFLSREIQLTREHFELLTNWESVARTKYKTSLGKHADIIKAQVELGKIEDKLASLEDMKRPVSEKLKAELNMRNEESLPIPKSIPDEEIGNLDSLKDLIRSNNPGLLALDHIIAKEKESVSLANKAYFPNFKFGISFIETGEALDPTMPESGKDPLLVSASINLPIWIGKKNAGRNEARARFKSAQYNRQDAENRLMAYFEKVLFGYNDAVRKINLYQGGLIPKTEQSLYAAFASYQASESDFLNLIDSERILLEFQLKLEEARVNKSKRLAEIELLAGIER